MNTQTKSAAPAKTSDRTRWYTVVMLGLIYASSQVDRQIMGILLEPIKLELGASDTAMGFLVGLTFALFYATLGMPIAMIADRRNRRNIIALAVAVWSAMTVACGLVANFWQMALARMGVAIGESGSTPPSHSIISDLFAPHERATAMSIFTVGANVGILIAFLGGGWMVDNWGWRIAFFVVGFPGLLLALVFYLTVREPERKSHGNDSEPVTEDAPRFLEVLGYMFRHPALRHVVIGKSLAAFIGYGMLLWLPAFLVRSHGLSATQVGFLLAMMIGVVGAIGTLLSGRIVDFLARYGDHWRARAVAISKLLIVPFFLIFLLADNIYVAFAAYLVPALISGFYLAPASALIQQLVKVRMRALAVAIAMFLVNMVGMGLGPQGVGILSDVLSSSFGTDSLRYALAIFTLVNVWCALHFWLAGQALKKSAA